MWVLRYADQVVKADIPSLSHSIQKRIRTAIETKLATDPIRFGKPLRYSLHHLRCLRVGDYRVLYALDTDKQLVSIVSIGHRKSVYDE